MVLYYSWLPHPTIQGCIMTRDAFIDLATQLGVDVEQLISLAWWSAAGQVHDFVHTNTWQRLVDKAIEAWGYSLS